MALIPGFLIEPIPSVDSYDNPRVRGFYRSTENIGYPEGYDAGYAAGFAAGEAAHASDYADGFAAGEIAGYADGFADGVSSVPNDEIPPTITVVSPTPGVDPGEPGGFPLEPELAKHTAIVLELVDAGGIAYAAVFARFDGGASRVPIFRRGDFEAGYSLFSFVEVIDEETTRLHVRADSGWGSSAVAFDVDVVDSGGNVT